MHNYRIIEKKSINDCPSIKLVNESPSIKLVYNEPRKKNRTKWSDSEDKKLSILVKNIGENWALISKEFDYKFSSLQCQNHWNLSSNPEIKKGKWSEEEEKKLLESVKINGPKNWKTISNSIKGRTFMQCRQHYSQMLDRKKRKTKKRDEIFLKKNKNESPSTNGDVEIFLLFIKKINN
jgi:hypothetical protein